MVEEAKKSEEFDNKRFIKLTNTSGNGLIDLESRLTEAELLTENEIGGVSDVMLGLRYDTLDTLKDIGSSVGVKAKKLSSKFKIGNLKSQYERQLNDVIQFVQNSGPIDVEVIEGKYTPPIPADCINFGEYCEGIRVSSNDIGSSGALLVYLNIANVLDQANNDPLAIKKAKENGDFRQLYNYPELIDDAKDNDVKLSKLLKCNSSFKDLFRLDYNTTEDLSDGSIKAFASKDENTGGNLLYRDMTSQEKESFTNIFESLEKAGKIKLTYTQADTQKKAA